MGKTHYDLAVVGAGIMGLSHAAAGLARGLKVAVFERNAAVTEASVRNFGLLTSLYDAPGAWGDRALRSRALYQSWSQRGWGCPLSTPGSLQLAQTPLQWALLQAYAASAPTLRYPVELLDAQAARARAPALGPGIHGALHFPGDGLLEPRVLFDRAAGLPAALASQGVALHWSSPIVALRARAGGGSVALTTASGEAFHASRVVLCSGSDVASLAPALFLAEAPHLRLCKLQMLRLLLPLPSAAAAAAAAAPPPPCTITSGLSLRRYPGPAAACPREHAAMMAGEGGPGSPSATAEALGVHIIARPAAQLPRTPFGAVAAAAAAGGQLALSPHEWIVGDSHEYFPLHSPGAGAGAGAGAPYPAFDESCSENVTDVILGVLSSMFQGLQGLQSARAGMALQQEGPAQPPSARILQQWSGVYLDHSQGFFSSASALVPGARGAQRLQRLSPADAAALPGGTLHCATGIGGKGMTMSPALGEEFIATYFP